MTKNQFKEKIIKEFEEKYFDKNSISGLTQKYLNSFTELVKAIRNLLLSSKLDEIVELAFRECGVKKKKVHLDEPRLYQCENTAFNSCIDERSKLEKLFKGEL